MCYRTQTALKGAFIFQRATSIIKTKHLQAPVICKECATFKQVQFILMSYSTVHTHFFASLFFPNAPQVLTYCVGGGIHPFCLQRSTGASGCKTANFYIGYQCHATVWSY